jgi:uncharacterized alpha-E superfamily protein
VLARTADNLYWLARYMERADFLARIIEATQRLASVPRASGKDETEWESALIASGAEETFHANYDVADEPNVVRFLAFSEDNPSSIRNCIEYARTNARAVRTALTAEMWDAINTSWLDLQNFDGQGDAAHDREETSRFLEFAKATSLVFDGSAYRTMLRNDAYWFSRVGLYIERADNTARILDVKYHVLLPETESIGGSLDYYQWTALLRSVSALTAYRWIYRESVQPWLVADLLILKQEMPRSLLACYDALVRFLDEIGQAYGQQGPGQRHARQVMRRLEQASIKDIFQSGLHEFLTEFVEDNSRLGDILAQQYLLN